MHDAPREQPPGSGGGGGGGGGEGGNMSAGSERLSNPRPLTHHHLALLACQAMQQYTEVCCIASQLSAGARVRRGQLRGRASRQLTPGGTTTGSMRASCSNILMISGSSPSHISPGAWGFEVGCSKPGRMYEQRGVETTTGGRWSVRDGLSSVNQWHARRGSRLPEVTRSARPS